MLVLGSCEHVCVMCDLRFLLMGFFGRVLANAIFPPVDFHSSVLAFQLLLYVQIIISLHFRTLYTPTEHALTILVLCVFCFSISFSAECLHFADSNMVR